MSIDVLPSCFSTSQYDQANKRHHLNNFTDIKHSSRRSSKPNSKYEATFVQNTVALAVISKLHKWCCQLFWLTIVCVIGCYGELNSNKRKTLKDVNRRCKTLTQLEMQVIFLIRFVPCYLTASNCLFRPRGVANKQWNFLHQRNRTSKFYFQLLRHLTCDLACVHRPLRPSLHKKQRPLSRMPSPHLFDIREDDEPVE